MAKDEIDATDIEAFIDGLKNSFDTLDTLSKNETHGFQSQLAKTISELRIQKSSQLQRLIIKPEMKKEDIKRILLKQLEILKQNLENQDINSARKFRLVMDIAKMRERIQLL